MTSSITRGLALAMVGVTLAGCATTGMGGAGESASAVDRARGTCVMTVLAGAALGAIIGNNSGNGSAGRGAAYGAAAGGLVCAVVMAMASEEDRTRIEMAQNQALESDAPANLDYVGSDGKHRRIRALSKVVADPAPQQALAANDAGMPAAATAAPRICRSLSTTLSVDGVAGPANFDEVLCRNSDSTWTRVRV